MQPSSRFLFATVVGAAGAFAQTTTPDPSINTPTGVIQCQPVQLTFSGTSPPFIITVQPGGDAGAPPLVNVGTTSETAVTWVANLITDTNYTLVCRDSMGRTGASAPFVIYPGTSTDCGIVTPTYTPASTPAATSSMAATSWPADSSGAPASWTPIPSSAAASSPAPTSSQPPMSSPAPSPARLRFRRRQ